MREEDVAYPPLDVTKPVAAGVHIVDSIVTAILGLQLPVRMTVIRLGNGDLLLHSPTRHTDDLRRSLDRLGRIRHLVAPNVAHWMFLQEWQRAVPDAVTWAAPGLRDRGAVKKRGVRLDRDLAAAPPPDWAAEIDQVVVPGRGFVEVAFMHKPSRTLVLTDLIVNLEPDKLPAPARLWTRLNGALAPDGRAPAYVRFVVRRKRAEAVAAAARLLAFAPERVVFSHGRWFERDGTANLRRSLRWLVP